MKKLLILVYEISSSTIDDPRKSREDILDDMNQAKLARLEDRNSPDFSIAHVMRRIQKEGYFVIKLDEPINADDLLEAKISMHNDIRTGVATTVFDTVLGDDEVALKGKVPFCLSKFF